MVTIISEMPVGPEVKAGWLYPVGKMNIGVQVQYNSWDVLGTGVSYTGGGVSLAW